MVNHVIRGGSVVTWELRPDFLDPLPYSFQLEVGRTANPDADDWQPVGLPVEGDTFYAIDSEQRIWAKTQWTHYRVVLATVEGTYKSKPEPSLGRLSRRDWRLAREIVRKERLRFGYTASQGYLLKRKFLGPRCTNKLCRDFQTGETTSDNCKLCYLTGFRGGYFAPMACVWAGMDPSNYRDERDAGAGRGTVNDIVSKARMLATVQMNEEDVFVDKDTDARWFVHRVQHTAEMRGVPLVADIELRLIPASHVLYDFPIPDQLFHEQES